MKIELFHVEPYCSDSAAPRQSVHVATLENAEGTILSALDRVYRCTQTVHTPWVAARGQFGLTIEPTQLVVDRGGCRSTSVGDYALVHVDGGDVIRFDCAPVGWRPVFPVHPAAAPAAKEG